MTISISSGPVLVEQDGAVVHLRLNQAEVSNGLDAPLLKALHGALISTHAEPGVRAVVLSGEGKNFCAGGHIRTFAAQGDALPDYLREATAWLQLVTAAMISLKAPVVGAIHGFCAGGGGFGLVCACDLVIAAESTQLFSGAVRVGMAPDAGTTATLPQIVGVRKALEILLLNPTLNAQEARELGIVTKVVPDGTQVTEALEVAEALAQQPPLAIAATKRLVWGGVGASVEARLPEEARTVSELSGTDDSREALAAVIERRAPKPFAGS